MVLVLNSFSDHSEAREVERILYLKPGDYGEETLVKVQSGCRIIFKLSPSLFGKCSLKLYTNYNCTEGRLMFRRSEYHQLTFNDETNFNEETSASCVIEHPGTFHFRFSTSTDSGTYNGGGYITVDPELTIFANKQRLSLNSIAMITCLPKCLGKFDDWKKRLQVPKECGYNFIHFPPVQSLGASNSSYSILDQMGLNHQVFGDGVGWEDIGRFTSFMQDEWGVLSLCDIVLNHTANETPWLRDFPDATFNLVNSPHLIPPYLIDRALVRVSEDIAADKLIGRGIPSHINDESHLNNLRVYLHEVLSALKLEEFYLINVSKHASDNVEFKEPVVKHSYKRHGSTVSNNVPAWRLEQINENTRNVIRSHISAAVENVLAGARYERIQNDGPRLEMVDLKNPLAHRYFYEIPEKVIFSENTSGEEVALNPAIGQFIMAHNGWVMNDDPLRNFAEESSNVYFRREVIPWGDSVKLRYGNQPSDSEFLWSQMAKYVQNTAKYFHGLRLDNCHSTPIHVAEYLLDCAREVRPNIFVIAELFTNSDAKDNVFVNRLGINSLVREAQSAWDSHEQGRLLFRFGGKPVGAFEDTTPPPIAKAILYDQTHDNPASISKRSWKDLLPTAALTSFGACAVGSTRGYDEIVPFHVHVVNESRLYSSFTAKEEPAIGEVNLDSGILRARKCLNYFHSYLGHEGFSETFIDQLTPDVIAATRHNPTTRETIVLMAYTAFSSAIADQYQPPFSIRAVEVEGQVMDLLFEGRLTSDSSEYKSNDEYLVGLRTKLEWRELVGDNLKETRLQSQFLRISNSDKGVSRIEFENFQPGDVAAVRIKPFDSTCKAVNDLGEFLKSNTLSSIISKLSLVDLNHILYRCKEEEGGVYSIPDFGDPIYAGLQGIASILDDVAKNNDLGHPLCSNLRNGDWLMDYIVMRLVSRPPTEQLGMSIQKIFQNIRRLPRYLVPTYFEKVFRKLYTQLQQYALTKMGANEKREFYKLLALTSLQFVGVASGGALCAGGDDYTYMEDGRPFIEYSLCAGLPHFSTGYMRNWGRDTFIALPGLLLLTGRYEEAKQHILSYASVMHRGLIPNLLNRGNCRYNCRDATWWWLYSIVRYISIVPDGEKILNETVHFNSNLVKLQNIMHFGIESHFNGIEFREANAGPRIDAHMKDDGFNIKIYTDIKTGFIHGGNALNCGTWMDKMGSNDFVKNRGLPATPRDGAAVEIQGLAAAVFSFLGNLKSYEHKHVQGQNGIRWSYVDWSSKIQENFEPNFFVSNTANDPLVNQRKIYKDTFGASNKYGDFQLRPNFLVAMVVAPQLFDKSNALLALGVVKEKLVSVLGIKTLDESDLNYDGNYWNQDSNDFKTAGGFNYHQGPEWLWPLSFYLRARLLFSGKNARTEVEEIISAHFDHISKSPWRSLPELTNREGAVCPGSCTAQAWSCGTLIEVLHEL